MMIYWWKETAQETVTTEIFIFPISPNYKTKLMIKIMYQNIDIKLFVTKKQVFINLLILRDKIAIVFCS